MRTASLARCSVQSPKVSDSRLRRPPPRRCRARDDRCVPQLPIHRVAPEDNIGRQSAVTGHNQYGFMIARDPHCYFFNLIVLGSRGLIIQRGNSTYLVGQTADWVRGRVKRWSLDSLKPSTFRGLLVTAIERPPLQLALTSQPNVFTVSKTRSLPGKRT